MNEESHLDVVEVFYLSDDVVFSRYVDERVNVLLRGVCIFNEKTREQIFQVEKVIKR